MNIKYVIYKNEMPASSTEAKYLGKVIPNGVRNRAQMTENALKTEHVAQATFDSVLNAAVDITKELCALGKDVDWGPMKFIAKMHGSLPCEDSAFADGTASLTVDADGTNATRAILDELVPVKASAAEIDSLIKVSNVMDTVSEAFGVIAGVSQFAILGNGITLDGEGEYAKVLDKKTYEVKATATVVSVSKGQRAYCKLPTPVTAGDYVLEVATKGLIGETTPRVFRKPVTILPATPIYSSTLGGTKIYSSVDDHGNALPAGPVKSTTATSKINMTGVFYQTPDADPDTGVSHIYLKNVGMTGDIELMGVFGEDHKSLMIRLGECITQVAAGTYENAKLSFTCYTDGQPDTLEVPIKLIKE